MRLGAEYEHELADLMWTGRLGFSYETSAIPPEYMSALTVDIDKLTIGLGGSVGIGAWRFDVGYAHVFGADVEVDPAEAKSPLLQPVKANVSEVHAVNGGTYSARAHVVGVGMRYAFDYQAPAAGGGAGGGEGEASEKDDEPASEQSKDAD